MTNLAFWLVCLGSAGLAFYLVAKRDWRIVPSMLAGTGAALLFSLPVLALTPGEERGHWLQVDLALNASIGLICAAVGAAAAMALRPSGD